ncbi:MAG: hypothetical protein ACRCXM_02940 [Beijerinckiaceae bacterium]
MRHSLKWIAVAGVLTVSSFAAKAQCVSPAPASPADLSALDANPQGFLSRFPDGGGAMVSAVRNLAVSSDSAAAKIMAVASTASPQQRSSIGTGLGQAAAACVQRNPSQALAIQRAMAAANDQVAMASYQAITGDARTAAIAAGGAGAPGGGFGGGGGGPGGSGVTPNLSPTGTPGQFARTTGTFVTPNSPFSLTTTGLPVTTRSAVAAASP